MSELSRQRFIQKFTACLYHSEWHFTTLLAACIHRIENLPDDADELIHQLLNRYSSKPDPADLKQFLIYNNIVCTWMSQHYERPFFKTTIIDKRLPIFENTADLLRWSGLKPGQLERLAEMRRIDFQQPSYFNNYVYATSPKRRGGVRLIEAPKSRLKSIQRKIYDNILCYAPVHRSAYGFQKQRNCRQLASLHTGKQYVFCFDLENCFQSITWLPVYKVFRRLGYEKKHAVYLSGLCTHRCQSNALNAMPLDKQQLTLLTQRHLPQGAPSSPALLNAVMLYLDKRLAGLAKSLNLQYSRYADDLIFSGDDHRDWGFLPPLVGSICHEEGFTVNQRKNRIKTQSQSQRVVGLVVNDGVNIDRRYFDNLKALLFNCVRFGPESQNHAAYPSFREHLLGKIRYVQSINAAKGAKLLKIYKKIVF